MTDAVVEVYLAFASIVNGEEDIHQVHASTAYAADDGASRSGRANLRTGCCNPLPTCGTP